MTVRISEYYDLFDINITLGNPNVMSKENTEDLPTDLTSTNETNPFRGFSNWDNFAAANPNNTVVIAGKHKAPQAIANIRVDENGDIWCYPPNVSVPYWNKVIFRNFDYYFHINNANPISPIYLYYTNSDIIKFPGYDLTDANAMKPDNTNTVSNPIAHTDFQEIPIFLKFDEYPSRSKVVFSSVDKTRNPDIEHRFSYHKGQMEPIKLNISLSCNNPITTTTNHWNWNLTRSEIEDILSKCYWSIEWVYERESGN